MAQVIVFENLDNSIGILHPTVDGYALGMIPIGEKDTPLDLPFWIVEDTAIPTDRSGRAGWTKSTLGVTGDPDGYGDKVVE